MLNLSNSGMIMLKNIKFIDSDGTIIKMKK